VKTPDEAGFISVMMGDDDERYLFSTSAGYGFVARLGDLFSRNKAGKAVITVPQGAQVLPAQRIRSLTEDRVCAISNTGSLLAFPVGELPEMAKGKGNKIYNIPGARFKSGEESMKALAVLSAGEKLRITSGKRHTTIKYRELEDYLGARGQRGRKLPRGFQNVQAVDVES